MMTCTQVREQLPALLDDRLATAAVRDLRAHLAACPDCERELAALSQTLRALDAMPTPSPTPRLRARVYAAIAAEEHALRSAPAPIAPAPRSARPLWFRWIQPLAAAALLALGFILGQRQIPSARRRACSRDHRRPDAATQRELAELRQKMDSMSQLVGYSILQQQSRSSNERLRGVLTSAAVAQPDDKTINDLIGASLSIPVPTSASTPSRPFTPTPISTSSAPAS
jgi:hypothetical protein